MEAPPPYPGLNTAPQQYNAYPQAFPAYGAFPAYDAFPMTGPNVPVYQNGSAAASAPMAPGFATGAERPPTYDEATKKTQ